MSPIQGPLQGPRWSLPGGGKSPSGAVRGAKTAQRARHRSAVAAQSPVLRLCPVSCSALLVIHAFSRGCSLPVSAGTLHPPAPKSAHPLQGCSDWKISATSSLTPIPAPGTDPPALYTHPDNLTWAVASVQNCAPSSCSSTHLSSQFTHQLPLQMLQPWHWLLASPCSPGPCLCLPFYGK